MVHMFQMFYIFHVPDVSMFLMLNETCGTCGCALSVSCSTHFMFHVFNVSCFSRCFISSEVTFFKLLHGGLYSKRLENQPGESKCVLMTSNLLRPPSHSLQVTIHLRTSLLRAGTTQMSTVLRDTSHTDQTHWWTSSQIRLVVRPVLRGIRLVNYEEGIG